MCKYLFSLVILVVLVSGCVWSARSPDEPEMNLSTGDASEDDWNTDSKGENPYINFSERYDAWRYDLFEIFRGTKALELSETLFSTQEYESHPPDEGAPTPEYIHRFTCNISLPQFLGAYPWAERLNAYYQDIMRGYTSEGKDVFGRGILDWKVTQFDYSFEDAYQVANVLTVIFSRFFAGGRASMEPFAEVFSAIDGQPLSLDDLFCVEREEYLPIVQASLLNAKNRFSEEYDPMSDNNPETKSNAKIIEYFDKASVAVTPVGLVFIYPAGYVDNEATGTIFLDVPFSALQGVLSSLYFPEGE